ncbi:hypothetical protein E2C01_029579 [Portunus trituberculatus]|uniref:Uncharacterized protein n=1 Tax=Portunus trituberculatus TaxID=210409 RepID=A0A5B7ENB1_PORTR|nr:hypothetical protein [Portunus trituberculatus]
MKAEHAWCLAQADALFSYSSLTPEQTVPASQGVHRWPQRTLPSLLVQECSMVLPNVFHDPHTVCITCRGSCTVSSRCEECAGWDVMMVDSARVYQAKLERRHTRYARVKRQGSVGASLRFSSKRSQDQEHHLWRNIHALPPLLTLALVLVQPSNGSPNRASTFALPMILDVPLRDSQRTRHFGNDSPSPTSIGGCLAQQHLLAWEDRVGRVGSTGSSQGCLGTWASTRQIPSETALTEEVTALLNKGAVEEAPPTPVFYSWLFVVPKVTGGFHLIIDLSCSDDNEQLLCPVRALRWYLHKDTVPI